MSPYEKYDRQRLAEVAARCRSINEMLRVMGLPVHGGTHAHISRRLRQLDVDTSHFTHPGRARRRTTHTPEALAAAAERSATLDEMLDLLGITAYDGADRYLRRRCSFFGIDLSHLRPVRRPSRLDPGEVRRAAEQAVSVVGTLRNLGLPERSSTARRHDRRLIEEHAIDIGHFTGQAHGRGRASPRRLGPADLLRPVPDATRRTQPHRLRRALLEIGRAYACALCGIPGAWRDRPLVLEVDHMNGDWRDNRAENLRFLCPNCHSQTDTYGGRNKARGDGRTGSPGNGVLGPGPRR